jgi:hypothetical protein
MRFMNSRNRISQIKSIFLKLFAILLLGSSVAPGRAAELNQCDMVLWYQQPATNWLQAMPLGGVPQEQNPPNRVVSDIFLFLKFPWGLKEFVDV